MFNKYGGRFGTAAFWKVNSILIHPQFVILLIEKALSLEKYKPRTMEPNGFKGRNVLALQI